VIRLTLWFIAVVAAGQPALTIYNQNFAVVRESVTLDLKAGLNQVTHSGVTSFVEPESITLRDPAGRVVLRIVEQNYRADPVGLDALLAAYEGQVIDFEVRTGDQTTIVPGRIVRAGNVQPPAPVNPYMMRSVDANSSPIVETNGKLRFGLPGVPLFPAISSGSVLKPVIEWRIHTPQAAKLNAELSYVTAAMSWEADYNIMERDGGLLDIAGWVTIDNRTGHGFDNVRLKLMAGDVNKVFRPELAGVGGVMGGIVGGIPGGVPAPVAQKVFDEYHLYSVPGTTTLAGRQKKQIEFVRASGAKSAVVYVYDGMKLDANRLRGMPPEALRMDSAFGSQSTNKVWVMREFSNSAENQLGVPLPKGKIRFYRRDDDGQPEFTGEDSIDHTPAGERIRVFTGAAFDLVGERRRSSHRIDHGRSTVDESFEIKVRNRKKEPAEVRIVEHLYRWQTWEIPVSSAPYQKTDSDTIEFAVALQPGEEKTVTYAVRYTW
jgi:hypothetical protein